MNNQLFLADLRSRSISPTSSLRDDLIQTPLRRSRRLSERSTTPSRDVSEEPIDQDEKVLRTRRITTPKKLQRVTSNPRTPKRSRKLSGGKFNEGISMTVLEPLIEDDEEKAGEHTLGKEQVIVKLDDLCPTDVPMSPGSIRKTRSPRYLIKIPFDSCI